MIAAEILANPGLLATISAVRNPGFDGVGWVPAPPRYFRRGGIVVAMNTDAAPSTVSVGLARQLRDAGLRWIPQAGDRFHMPDHDFGDRVWTISEMVIEERFDILGRKELAFNGSVEWALDSIFENEVVWVPTEGQLRHLLDDGFVALTREDDGSHSCVIRLDSIPTTFTAPTAADAYAEALLATLQ